MRGGKRKGMRRRGGRGEEGQVGQNGREVVMLCNCLSCMTS